MASEAERAWDRTKDTANIAVLKAFMARFKDTYYAELARARLEELKQQQASEGERKRVALKQQQDEERRKKAEAEARSKVGVARSTTPREEDYIFSIVKERPAVL